MAAIKQLILDGDIFEETDAVVIGVPYGGPHNGRDTDGEAFEKNTRHIGTLPYVWVTLNHGKAIVDPIQKDAWVETDPIGVGEFIERNEKGAIYRIWTSAQKGYRELINLLYHEKSLTMSNTPLQRAAHAGLTPDGIFKSYPTVELAVTPTPANELAVGTILREKGIKMSNSTNTATDAPAVVDTPATSAAVSDTPITDEIDRIINESTPAATAETPTEQPGLAGLVVELQKSVNLLNDKLAIIEKAVGGIERLEKSVSDQGLALPKIMRRIEKGLGVGTVALTPEQIAAANAIEKAQNPGTNPAPAASGLDLSGTRQFTNRKA